MSIENLFQMNHCMLCPRNCGADRAAGQTGFCGEPAQLYCSRAALMEYEEPCISIGKGSGAIFFNGCNLGCIFCQNTDISRGMRGKVRGTEVTAEELVKVMFSLQEQEAANINLVTPSHYLHVIIPALQQAKSQGLRIPVVYNTSSYEKPEAIRYLEGLVDIYIPDIKFCSAELSGRWIKAPDYYRRARAALKEMVRQCPEPVFANGAHSIEEDETPAMLRGVIVRHLVMPGQTDDSKRIIRELYEEYGNRIFFSIMSQYTPMPEMTDPDLMRKLTPEEYDDVVDYAIDIGVENGFIQEGDTVSRSFIPNWDLQGLHFS